jgi:hypothetical protein
VYSSHSHRKPDQGMEEQAVDAEKVNLEINCASHATVWLVVSAAPPRLPWYGGAFGWKRRQERLETSAVLVGEQGEHLQSG